MTETDIKTLPIGEQVKIHEKRLIAQPKNLAEIRAIIGASKNEDIGADAEQTLEDSLAEYQEYLSSIGESHEFFHSAKVMQLVAEKVAKSGGKTELLSALMENRKTVDEAVEEFVILVKTMEELIPEPAELSALEKARALFEAAEENIEDPAVLKFAEFALVSMEKMQLQINEMQAGQDALKIVREVAEEPAAEEEPVEEALVEEAPAEEAVPIPTPKQEELLLEKLTVEEKPKKKKRRRRRRRPEDTSGLEIVKAAGSALLARINRMASGGDTNPESLVAEVPAEDAPVEEAAAESAPAVEIDGAWTSEFDYVSSSEAYAPRSDIQRADGTLLGEYGVTTTAESQIEDSQYAAMEVWLFDINDVNTTAAIFVAPRAGKTIMNELPMTSAKPVVPKVGMIVPLESKTLNMSIKVVEVELGGSGKYIQHLKLETVVTEVDADEAEAEEAPAEETPAEEVVVEEDAPASLEEAADSFK
jgi:hypothetical protein